MIRSVHRSNTDSQTEQQNAIEALLQAVAEVDRSRSGPVYLPEAFIARW